MKKISLLLIGIVLAFGLVACGSSTPKAAATVDDYNGWSLEFSQPTVVYSEDDASDVLLIKMKATNNGDKASTFASYDNFLAFPGDSDDYLATAYSWADYDLTAEEQETAVGGSIESTHAYLLKGYEGDVRYVIQGYVEDEDDTEITFTGIAKSDEAKKAEEAAGAELAEKQAADSVTIKGATITKPDGWYFDKTSDTKVTIKQDDSSAYVDVSFATTSDDPADRAAKFAGNYKNASEVMSATVAGTEWAYYLPVDDQFDAYAQADGGCINASGMFVNWDDAQAVIESISIG